MGHIIIGLRKKIKRTLRKKVIKRDFIKRWIYEEFHSYGNDDNLKKMEKKLKLVNAQIKILEFILSDN